MSGSSSITYSFPGLGGDSYYYGTDIENLDNNLSSERLYSKNATELRTEIENVSDSLSRVQNSMDSWLGNSSDEEKNTMVTVIEHMNTIVENISNSIIPACESMEQLEETIQSLRIEEDKYNALKNELSTLESSIASIDSSDINNEDEIYSLNVQKKDLNIKIASQKEKLDSILEECNSLYNSIKEFESLLSNFDIYFKTGLNASGILDNPDLLNQYDIITKYLLMSGSYYSNQCAPSYLFNIMYETGFIDNYGNLTKDVYGILSDKYNSLVDVFNSHGVNDIVDIYMICKKAAEQGCGYAAIANELYDTYKDNPERFEQVYGYPLYHTDEYGNTIYNYESIFMDAYLTAQDYGIIDKIDTSTEQGLISSNYAVVSLRDDYLGPLLTTMLAKDPQYSGLTTADSRLVYVNYQPEERNINNREDVTYSSDLYSHESTVELYKKYIDAGYDSAIIAAYDFTLKPIGNNVTTTKDIHCDYGHWMQITGVSENGNFIVSSWGGQYELVNYKWGMNDDNGEFYCGGALTFINNP